MRIGYTKDMTNTQITVGTIVTHAIIGCEWKVVRGDDEYSTLVPRFGLIDEIVDGVTVVYLR